MPSTLDEEVVCAAEMFDSNWLLSLENIRRDMMIYEHFAKPMTADSMSHALFFET